MKTRRYIMLGSTALALAACGVAASPDDLNPVWLRVSASDSGYLLRVDDETVELDQLEQVLLDRAVVLNPHLTREEARESVRVYVRADPDTPPVWIEDLTPMFNRFGRVGLVAQDRRE